jgi:hypothetical protein
MYKIQSFNMISKITSPRSNRIASNPLRNSQIGNAVEVLYRRGDLFAKRVALMADWAA